MEGRRPAWEGLGYGGAVLGVATPAMHLKAWAYRISLVSGLPCVTDVAACSCTAHPDARPPYACTHTRTYPSWRTAA